MLFRNFQKNHKVLKLLTFESHDAFGIFNNLFKSYKVSEVTKFKILQFLYNFSAKKFIITKLQSYEVTTETSVKSIHVSCHPLLLRHPLRLRHPLLLHHHCCSPLPLPL